MNIEYFKTFVCLSKTRNFSAAAQRLHVSQSTVSNRIKELELYYNQALFVRTNKWVELSEVGQRLLPEIQRILDIEAQAKAGVENTKYLKSVRIGSPHAAYRGFLTEGLKRLLAGDHESVKTAFKITISHTEDILRKLSDGLLDIGLVAYLPKNMDLHVAAKVGESVVLIACKKEGFDSLTPEEIVNLTMLQSDLGQAFEAWLNETSGTRVEYALSIDQISEVVEYVAKGYGCAFVPESLADKGVESGKIKKVDLIHTEPFRLTHYLVVKDLERRVNDLAPYLDVLAFHMERAIRH